MKNEKLVILETNIDDSTPELLADTLEGLLEIKGVMDAWLTPIIMKHGRPAVKLSVLSDAHSSMEAEKKIFLETSTLGIRVIPIERHSLHRKIETLHTEYGAVKVKIGFLDGMPVTVSPEYKSCKDISLSSNVPLKDVYNEACRTAYEILNNRRNDFDSESNT